LGQECYGAGGNECSHCRVTSRHVGYY
jgi:hypothetical protein